MPSDANVIRFVPQTPWMRGAHARLRGLGKAVLGERP